MDNKKTQVLSKGMHLYVNIRNLNYVIRKEEKQTNNLSRVFHAMDNYVSTIEDFINTYNDEVYVEKLTNSRLHIVFYDTVLIAENFLEVIKFLNQLTGKINSDNKYQKLVDFKVSMGADYGYFTEFDFNPTTDQNSVEFTSIGFPANRAAKLEGNADEGELLISIEGYTVIRRLLTANLSLTSNSKAQKINIKYSNSEIYTFSNFENIADTNRYRSKFNTAQVRYSNNITQKRFGDIIFTDANKQVNFDNLSLLSPKRIDAVVIYADIRGFTKKFNKDGSNLIAMSRTTKLVLKEMYDSVINKGGTHVQFQGDRESAFRNDYDQDDYVLKGLQTAMYILEKIKLQSQTTGNNFHIGIGCSHGTVYAAKVGIRGHKHNLILGETVKKANFAEDEHAGDDQIAITQDMYSYLLQTKNSRYKNVISDIFKYDNDGHYVTSTKFSEFTQILMRLAENYNSQDAKPHNPQRPWHDQSI